MNNTYEITWSLEFESHWEDSNCKNKDDAIKKFKESVGEQLNEWSWDLAKEVKIKKIDLIKEEVNA
tara:strand:- start:7977 stop:8174 length:198 start_codon:yes stop_codon:yes gene_type:complete